MINVDVDELRIMDSKTPPAKTAWGKSVNTSVLAGNSRVSLYLSSIARKISPSL
jgi:hypothetical protein